MKILYLIRGLPGSGKSSLAEIIQPDKNYRFAADDYFTDSFGKYRFDPKLIGEAHEHCQFSAGAAMDDGENVVIHNTLSQPWESPGCPPMFKKSI